MLERRKSTPTPTAEPIVTPATMQKPASFYDSSSLENVSSSISENESSNNTHVAKQHSSASKKLKRRVLLTGVLPVLIVLLLVGLIAGLQLSDNESTDQAGI